MVTIKEKLIKAGMTEAEIHNHYSDLYVKVTPISNKFVSEYEFKEQVTTFVNQIDHKLWYEIPFGYFDEYYKKYKEWCSGK